MSPITLGILAGTGGPTGLGWLGEYSATYDFANGREIEVDSTGAILISSGSQVQKLSNAGVSVFNRSTTISGTTLRHEKIARNAANSIFTYGTNDTTQNAQFMQFDASGNTVFQRRFFSSQHQAGDIAVASSGNVYLFGRERPSGGNTRGIAVSLNTGGGGFGFYTHIAPAGQDAWINAGGIDSQENVYVGGGWFPSSTTRGILVKLNSSNQVQWRRTIDEAGAIQKIAVTSAGVVYVIMQDSINPALLKFNTSGTLQWQRQLTSGDFLYDVKLDSSENIYVVASTGGGTATATRIVKWNSSGVLQWSRIMDVPSVRDEPMSIAVDSAGSFYLASQRNISFWNQRLLIAKLPDNGGLTGTYVVDGITYNYSIGGSDLPGNTVVATGTFSVGGQGGVGDPLTFTPSMTEITNTFAITPI